MLSLFFRLPFWMYLVMAVCFGYMTERLVVKDRKKDAEITEALKQDPPQVVDLSGYDPARNKALADEVTVSGWINTEHNTELTKSKNGITTGTRYMFVMAGEGDSEGSQIARAVLILTEAERDFFAENSGQFLSGLLPQGFEMTFNGRATSSMSFSDVARKAMKEQGVTRAENFFYLQPYFYGREAALSPDPNAALDIRTVGYGIAGVLVLLALSKIVMRRKNKRPQKGDSFANGPIVTSGVDLQPQTVARTAHANDSPVGRLATAEPSQSSEVEEQVSLVGRHVPKRATQIWVNMLWGVAGVAAVFILPPILAAMVAVGILAWRMMPQGRVQPETGGIMSRVWARRSKEVSRKLASDPFERLRQPDHRQV
ncbi:hypothetical protein [Falsiruegeria mediterranea]|uniref:Uncharacterized protein n=1 Tax=Falsiruegeria mediterranea M17 TaxID=1200281 RepID=A0A2R8CG25_9RHOB|nr:hypothetical protein [Falsiruegeria mediterranea]SPJ31208.1 hypothetical protein TRM7615_04751 [Falsiruegeria mediterranea M17]